MPVVTAQAPLPTSASQLQSAPAAESPLIIPAAPEAPSEEAGSLAPRFAALAKQQKQIRREQQALKAREDAIKAKLSDYETNYIPKARIKENPLELLVSEGYSYDQIAELLLKQSEPQSQQFSQIEREMAKLRSEQQEAIKKMQEAETYRDQQAEREILRETKLLIDSDPEYETLKSDPNGADAVVLLIKKTLEAGGGFLSVEQAAKKVEDYLLEEALQKANLKKVRARMFPEQVKHPALKTQQQSSQAQIQPRSNQPQNTIRTLTNAASASSSRPMTPQQKRERAILAFMGQLEG